MCFKTKLFQIGLIFDDMTDEVRRKYGKRSEIQMLHENATDDCIHSPSSQCIPMLFSTRQDFKI